MKAEDRRKLEFEVQDMESFVARCLGASDAEPSKLGEALSVIVERESSEVLGRPHDLVEALRAEGLSEMLLLQVELLVRIPGYKEMVTHGDYPLQVDVDRFVQNACETSGLSRPVVLRLTADLAIAAGAQFDLRPDARVSGNLQPDRAFVVPTSAYHSELMGLEKTFRQNRDKTGMPLFTSEEIEQLDSLVAIGIPRAIALKGAYLVNSAEAGGLAVDTGVAWLREAAKAGDSFAAAKLGDVYYNRGTAHWSEALDMYTGPGAAALDSEGSKRVTDILGRRVFNYRTLVICTLMLLVFLGCVILAPGAPMIPDHRIVGVVFLIVASVVLGFGWMRWKSDCYEDLFAVPLVMTACWCLYSMARFLV